MATSVAEQLVEELRDSGVQRIYGLVGDSLNPIVDAVRRTEAIGRVHVHNKEAAAFAAAEVRFTGRLAVCAGSCGLGSRPHLNRSRLLGLRSLRPGSL